MLSAMGLLLACLAGCGSSDANVEPAIPSAVVSDLVNLTTQEAAALRFDKGFIYRPGGVRGIIVVRQSAQQYLAFERNCSYQPYDACAKVSVDASRFFLVDTCCASRFDLTNGLPTSGPARRSLRQYTTTLNGNLLYITN
ncbi:hypothetical protein GCM10028821_16680 [Hymenobacter jeollabukensis]